MFDWNGNGKEDWGDYYIDYEIYKDVTGENDDAFNGTGNLPTGNSDGEGCGCLLLVIGAIILLSIF